MTELTDDAAGPEPDALASPVTREGFERSRFAHRLPRPLEPHCSIANDDLAVAPNQRIERSDAIHVRPPFAAGTGCIVRLALQLRAVDEHGFETLTIQAIDGERCEPLVDGVLVDSRDDLGDRPPGRREHRHRPATTLLDHNTNRQRAPSPRDPPPARQ